MSINGEKVLGNERATLGSMQGIDGLQVDVTVLRANNLPLLKNRWGKERRFYVTIANGSRTRKTKSIHSQGQSVSWNEKLDAFVVQSPDIRISLYAEHHIHVIRKDELIGSLDIVAESTVEAAFAISNRSAPHLKVVLTVETRELIGAAEDAIDDADQALAGMHVLEEWKGTVENIQWVMETVGVLAELNPYAQMAWNALSSVPKVYICVRYSSMPPLIVLYWLLLAQFEYDENVRALVEAMRSMFDLAQAEDLLKAIKPNSNQALILKVMLRHMKLCSEIIKRYTEDKKFMKRLMRNIIGGTAREIQELCETLAKLRQELLDNAVISTQIVVERIQKSMNILPKQISDMDLDAKMNDLPYKSGWRSMATIDKNGCLPGTRTDFLEHIINWVDGPSANIGLALLGQAGTGKSTIAHEIALRFQLEDRLGSYFSFSRNEKSKREDHHLFTTIIHDLANRYPLFKTALGELIRDNKPLRVTDDFNLLLSTLLLKPLRDVDVDIPILIVIDALDESADAMGKKGLAAFLAKSLCQFPSKFRVLITSRLDGDIKDWFANAEKNPFEIVEMSDSKLAKTEDDIRLYFQDPLNLSPNLFRLYGDALVQKSEGLFQWAAVACGHIKEPPSGWTEHDCLRGLLNRTVNDKEYAQELHRPLYELYENVLSGYFNSDIARRRFRSVMGHLLAAVEPFSVNSLTILRQSMPFPDQHDEGAVLAIVKHLGSLLSNVTSENHDLPIVPLHTSFRDFLTDDIEKGDSFSVNLQHSHTELTHACLSIMLRELKFNICELESSYLSNSKVPDLQSQIDKHIQPALFYACRFWDDHLERVSSDDILLGKLQQLFNEKFLFWLEVLSVTDTVPLAVQAFALLKSWMHSGVISEAIEARWMMLNDLVTDAYQFLRYFAMPIAESAAHIYISALPFTPTSSKVYQAYSHAFPNTLAFECGQQANWPALEMTFQTPYRAFSVIFSPDGQYVAIGSEDNTVSLWNATTGRMEGGSFIGHSGTVRSVAFSPDGKWIVSGSDDTTICVWNVSTRDMERDPLVGHTKAVTSVAFSPDGQWIASGSNDKTVLLWNTSTGKIERGPYVGHTMEVTSVAFSPDGKLIVSGSRDKDIRFWNTSTGEQEKGPLSAHTDSITSVSFSPDGQLVVSGSEDNTILLWNVSTGALERGPITGHSDSVTSVAFSPDGSRIVSGSFDKTVRLWNVVTGNLERSLLNGHTYRIHSVAFSLDGQRIVSGSYGQTFCLWNANARELEQHPSIQTHPTSSLESSSDGRVVSAYASPRQFEDSIINAHTDGVISVAFSPDGNWIVSGSDNSTLCLWNASIGQLRLGPLKGHSRAVGSVTFSPDGKWIASGSDDATIILWNASTGEIELTSHVERPAVDALSDESSRLPFSGHTDGINSVAFSPDGRRIVSGSYDKTLCMWNASTGELVGGPFTGHTDAVASVAFSPDGKWIGSGSFDNNICLWNASTGELERGPLTGHTKQVSSITFSPNGTYIVSGSVDCTVRLWNVSTRLLEREPFTGHTSLIFSVAFSPDGKWIVSASLDTTIRVWNTSSGELEYVLPSGHIAPVNFVTFSPNGTQIALTGLDGTIRIMAAHQPSAAPYNEDSFNDRSVIDPDGWIRGDQGQLLLWIPALHRSSLYRPNVPIHIIGRHQTRLSTSKFVHGSNWAACYVGR